MTAYERLQDLAHSRGLTVKEAKFVFYDGLIKGKTIGIRKSIDTQAEKADTLAEELSHSELTVGNILDQTVPENRKQEHKARLRAYKMRVGLDRIVEAIEMGCRNSYEASEYLEVSEKFFTEALEYYRQKYGECVEVGDYTLVFEPTINLIKNK